MKKIITPALLLISLFSFSQSDVPRSNRIASVVKIDGDAADWHLPLRFYDSETKLFFDFSNDDNNLYLCFQSNDNMEEMKIMRAGITVTVSTKGKGKSKASIRFPLETENKKPNDANNNMMEIKGFKTKDGLIAINNNSGINAAMNRDANKKLTYEISVPLRELSGEDFIKDFTKEIELTVEVHALKQNSSGSGEKSFSGRGNGGGGRMGGGSGRMGGGGGGGMHRREGDNGTSKNDPTENNLLENADKTSMFEKAEFKQKFTLSAKQ